MVDEKKKSRFDREMQKDQERKRITWSRINRVVSFIREKGEVSLSEITAHTGVSRYFILTHLNVIEDTFPDIMWDEEGTFYCRDVVISGGKNGVQGRV